MSHRRYASGWAAVSVAVITIGSLLLFAGGVAATQPEDLHCPGEPGGNEWKVDVSGDPTTGSFDVDGTMVWYEISGPDVWFFADEDMTEPLEVTFCVKAGTDNSGELTGDSFTVDWLNNGGQTPDISYLVVYEVPTPPELGSITVDKVVAGTGASTTEAFSFTMTDEAGFTLTGAAAPKLFDDLEAGVYVVAEAALTAGQTTAGWAFTSVSCTGGGTVVAGQQATVTLTEGQDVTCTFTNTFTAPIVLTPTLTLDKVVTAGASTTTKFGFTLGGQAVSTTLAAADAPLLLSSTAGAYVLAENAMTGWNTSAIDCTGNAAAETVNLTTRTVNVTVGANEDVVCTFTNTPQGGQVLPGNPTPTPKATVKPTPRGAVLPSTSMPLPGIDLALVGSLFVLAASGVGAATLIERRRR